MKIHKMSHKQFAKFLTRMVKYDGVDWSSDKYDYYSRPFYDDDDVNWIIYRSLGGAKAYEMWAWHDTVHECWAVREIGKKGPLCYHYFDKDLRKAVQDD